MKYSLTLLLQIATCSVTIAAESPLDNLKSSYQAQLDKIIENHSATMTALSDQVVSALTRAQQEARKANDGSEAAIGAEIEMWKKEGNPPSAGSTVPAASKIYQIYQTQKQAKTLERDKLIATWYRTYDSRLADLVSKGESAEDVKDEREKLADSFLVKSALENVKSAPVAVTGSGSSGSATDPKPPAPAASPSAALGPWQNLKKVKWDSLEGNEYFKGGVEKWKDDIKFQGKVWKVRDIIYTHGGGAVTYKFKTPITAFKATGCMEERTGQGNVFFVIETDEGEVYRTKPVTKDHTSEPIDITFKPSLTLKIKSDPNGGAQEDWAFLLEPKFR